MNFFYAGRYYAGLTATYAQGGGLSPWNASLLALANVSDGSGIVRLSGGWTVLNDLSLGAYVQGALGRAGRGIPSGRHAAAPAHRAGGGLHDPPDGRAAADPGRSRSASGSERAARTAVAGADSAPGARSRPRPLPGASGSTSRSDGRPVLLACATPAPRPALHAPRAAPARPPPAAGCAARRLPRCVPHHQPPAGAELHLRSLRRSVDLAARRPSAR